MVMIMGIDLGRFKQDEAAKEVDGKLKRDASFVSNRRSVFEDLGERSSQLVPPSTTPVDASIDTPVEPQKPRSHAKFRLKAPQWRPVAQKVYKRADIQLMVKNRRIHLPASVTLSFLAAIIVAGAFLVFLSHAQANKANKTAQLYGGLMSDLTETVQKVKFGLNGTTGRLSAEQLDAYSGQMTRLDYDCYGVRNTSNVQPNDSKAVKASVKQAQQLCNDLIPVADYSKAVYAAARDVLLLNASTSAGDSGNLAAAIQAIDATADAIKALNYPSVQDPAQSEIVTVLQQASKAAADLKPYLDKDTSNQPLEAAFTKKLQSAQNEIMNARPYYWNNTIQIDALLRATQKLSNTFSKEAKSN